MKQVIKHTIQIQPVDDRYGQRAMTIILSNEVITFDDIVQITGIAQKAAMWAGPDWEFSVTTSSFAVYETEDEKAEAKAKADAEAAEREATTTQHRTEIMSKVIEAANAMVADQDINYTVAIEHALDDTKIVPYYEANAVRAMLKKANAYTLD